MILVHVNTGLRVKLADKRKITIKKIKIKRIRTKIRTKIKVQVSNWNEASARVQRILIGALYRVLARAAIVRAPRTDAELFGVIRVMEYADEPYFTKPKAQISD